MASRVYTFLLFQNKDIEPYTTYSYLLPQVEEEVDLQELMGSDYRSPDDHFDLFDPDGTGIVSYMSPY